MGDGDSATTYVTIHDATATASASEPLKKDNNINGHSSTNGYTDSKDHHVSGSSSSGSSVSKGVKQKLNALSGVKTLCALAMFGQHAQQHTNGLHLTMAACNLFGGVTIFFILSGFGLVMGYQECSMKSTPCKKKFWWRRLARTLPVH